MKYIFAALLVITSAGSAIAQSDVDTTIAVVVYQCLNPKNDPACVAPDQESKSTCCPDCKSWEKVRVTVSLTASLDRSYSQPKLFVADIAERAYGVTPPKDRNGNVASVAQLYANPEKYGWVEIKGDQSKQGMLAVLPNTAGVVVDQNSANDVTVLYSSSRRSGVVKETDLDYLATKAEPKFIVPKQFLAKEAMAMNIKP